MTARLSMLCLFLAGVVCGVSADDGVSSSEGWRHDIVLEDRLRIADVIRQLDSPFVLRRREVESLVAMGRGADNEIVYQQLIEALSYHNPQVREAVVEVMIRIGDPRFSLQIVQQLPFESMMDIRRLSIRMLPIFSIPGELHRREAIQMYFADFRSVTPRLRELMRMRPLRRGSWEEDVELARMRRRVESAITDQLDPIDRMMSGLDIKGRRAATIEMLQEHAGSTFGENTDDAREGWRTRRRTFALREERLVIETETIAAQTLADIGAFGAAAKLEELGLVERESAQTAALAALGELSRYAYVLAEREPAELDDRRPSSQETHWRAVERAAAVTAVEAALRLASLLAESDDELVRSRAYETLGATRREEGVTILRAGGIRTGNGSGTRVAICRALAEIGGLRAVEGLTLLANYRGYAMDAQGQREEYQVVLSSLTGLVAIAGRASDEGRLAAFEALAVLLGVDRGAPGHLPIREQARRAMQQAFGRPSASYDPKEWARWHAEYLGSGNAAVRPPVLRASEPEGQGAPESSAKLGDVPAPKRSP